MVVVDFFYLKKSTEDYIFTTKKTLFYDALSMSIPAKPS